MSKFDIEAMYQQYLTMAKIDEKELPAIERRERKTMVYGGCTSILKCMRDDVAAIEDEDAAVTALQNMIDQCKDYFMAL
jgi:hypothetical protein